MLNHPKLLPEVQFSTGDFDDQEVELPNFREVDDVLRVILSAVSSRPNRNPF